MKNNDYSGFRQKLNKRRLIGTAVLLIWLLSLSPLSKKEDWLLSATAQMVPLLTFEAEYGNPENIYASDYAVPDWFYEDEDAPMSGGDGIMTELRAEEAESVGEEPAAALSNGVKGTVYTEEQLAQPDFLLSKIFVVDSNTSMAKEELDLENLMMNLTVEGLKTEGEEGKPYKILIYHTHGSEGFADSREGVQEDTIVGMGSYLTALLEEQYGIAVYHDTTNYDIVDGVLDRNKAFEVACANVTRILQENPSIEVVIDLHRDGVEEDTRLVTEVNGKPTAKIMFVNGVSRSNLNGEIGYLDNPHKLANLAFSFQMYLAGKELYGDYVRKIYVRSLRFNLHLMPKTALIEVGAQNNTVEEEKNAMEPLAAILDKVLSKQE
ncbi:MAG: stage II sporulation protein P [Bacteroidales bacterium]|nr:stage II sporulation protein P [Clostridium sp.]MCM1202571.1 stage II sporulation protein P [Bacteroidales bacterium]